MRPVRAILVRSFESGRQKATSLTQYASFTRRSARPNASINSTVRQATPSAWPISSGPSLRSMITVLRSEKLAICAASTRPAGTAPDDQDVRVLGQVYRPLRDRRMWVLDKGVTRLVAVEIELHFPYPP